MQKPLWLSLLAALTLTGAISVRPSTASAQIFATSPDPAAWLSPSGRYAQLTGPIVCTPGQAYQIIVSLAHQESGVQAFGATQGDCNGALQRWTVLAAPLEFSARLTPGKARICWQAITWAAPYTTAQHLTDRHQGCGPITLAGRSAPLPPVAVDDGAADNPIPDTGSGTPVAHDDQTGDRDQPEPVS